MALSGRFLHGATSLQDGGSVVILNLTDQGGMLRVFDIIATVPTNTKVKIEIDGNIIFNNLMNELVLSNTYFLHGLAIISDTTNGVRFSGKVLNLPFVNSIKITLSSTYHTTNNVSYSGDYVLDI